MPLPPSRVFCATDKWKHLLCLLERCHNFVCDLGDDLCTPLANIIDNTGLVERAVALVDRMTEEQLQRVSEDVRTAATK